MLDTFDTQILVMWLHEIVHLYYVFLLYLCLSSLRARDIAGGARGPKREKSRTPGADKSIGCVHVGTVFLEFRMCY